jgi:hypothetical protein
MVSVHVGAVKIYVAAVEALRKKERRGVKTGSNSVWHKKWCISEFDTPQKVNVLFLKLTRFWTKLRLLAPCWKTLIFENLTWVRGFNLSIFFFLL